MPDGSCAISALELLRYTPGTAQIADLKDPMLQTPLELSPPEDCETEVIMADDRISVGLSFPQSFGIKHLSDPRDLRRYLDKKVHSRDKFAVIYSAYNESGFAHAYIISNMKINVGSSYEKKEVKPKGKSKKNQARRTVYQRYLEMVRKCVP